MTLFFSPSSCVSCSVPDFTPIWLTGVSFEAETLVGFFGGWGSFVVTTSEVRSVVELEPGWSSTRLDGVLGLAALEGTE